MSDGGDGFGQVLRDLLEAEERMVKTVDAAHRSIRAVWWWQEKSRTAIVEAARVNGLAMLPSKKFHPFQLDTFGLGAVLDAAEKAGAKKCVVGIGGSATNDGGFGLACALGWKFFGRFGDPIREWWQLEHLAKVQAPEKPLKLKVTVAVDVANPLLGPKGCSRIYGPQKGLRPDDFLFAEKNLGRLAEVMRQEMGKDFSKVPGSGAAGGLGFGLMTFAAAKVESGFQIFADLAQLEKRIRATDLVITGEGAMDEQTYMGKGVGRIAQLCRWHKVPCLGLAGVVVNPGRAKKFFSQTRSLVKFAGIEKAIKEPENILSILAARAAFRLKP